MNYEQANAVKELAPRVNRVLEGLERECPRCEGFGHAIRKLLSDTKSPKRRKCDKCNGKGKLHYSWTPQVGEWCINKEGGYPQLISDIAEQFGDLYLSSKSGHVWLSSVNLIPILEWEEIERIIKKAGYGDELYDMTAEDEEYVYCIWTGNQDAPNFEGRGKSRIEAVYKAIIELGKELKK